MRSEVSLLERGDRQTRCALDDATPQLGPRLTRGAIVRMRFIIRARLCKLTASGGGGSF